MEKKFQNFDQKFLDRVKRLTKLIKQPTLFFDLETTGKETGNARIVQFCGIIIFPEIERGDYIRLESLINPGMAIPAESTAVHGITDEMVKDQPTFKEFASQITDLFNQSGAIAGYNILKFDLPVLETEFLRIGQTPPFTPQYLILDFLPIYRKLFPNTLSAVYERFFGDSFEGSHNAEADVLATAAIAAVMLAEGKDADGNPFDMENPDKIQAFAEDAPLVDFAGHLTLNDKGAIVWNFGKNKGQLVNADYKYKEWFLGADFPAGSKAIVRSIR